MPTLDNYSLSNYGLGGFDKGAPLELLDSGTTVTTAGQYNAVNFDNEGAQGGTFHIQVDNRKFGRVPKLITLRRSGSLVGIYVRDVKNSFGNSLVTWTSIYSAVTGSPFYVTDTSFRLPTTSGSTTFNWEVYG